MIIIWIFGDFFHWSISIVFPSYSVKNIEVEESLDNYWLSLN
jgi:hypothetical protein